LDSDDAIGLGQGNKGIASTHRLRSRIANRAEYGRSAAGYSISNHIVDNRLHIDGCVGARFALGCRNQIHCQSTRPALFMKQCSSPVPAMSTMHKSAADPQTETLLQDATEYATRAIASMVSQLEEDYGTPNKLFYDYVRLIHGLEAHFLFPNLDDQDRDLVVALLSARSAMMVGLKKLETIPHGEPRHESEAFITHLRNRFADFKGQIDNRRIVDKLTSTQRRVLDQIGERIQTTG
jgi:hypothetical protein